jgi:hypothetical protein
MPPERILAANVVAYAAIQCANKSAVVVAIADSRDALIATAAAASRGAFTFNVAAMKIAKIGSAITKYRP